MAGAVGAMAPRGELMPQFRPRHGYYHGPAGRRLGLAILPAGIPFKYRLRTLWKELTLHTRLAWIGFWRGLIKAEGVFGIGRLHATVFRGDGRIEHLGLVSTKLITDAGVAFLVDDWDVNTASATNDITTLKYHGAGTGTTAESAAQTGLITESTTALNPDSTRATGTQSQPAANQLRSVGTLTFDADAAITEHGLFSQAATGGGTLWDRSLFSAINVVGANGDSIQFTYTCTVSSGG